ncbi:MAG: hypothetical protein PHU25_15525 [Deltaproteobacteria bacterium]|nr:hypothetical protein [Deltaproteobacteria bacterium]
MRHVPALAFAAWCLACLATGCLATTDDKFPGYCDDAGDSEGCHNLTAGDMTLKDFQVGAPGMDPPGASSSTDRDYCQIMLDCVCEYLSGTDYDTCVAQASSWDEIDCETFLEDSFPECL